MRKLLATVVAAAGLLMSTQIAAADGVPSFSYEDCPKELPAGATGWRCEVLVTDGTGKFGALGAVNLARQRLTFAEGQLNGEYAQVFGALRAEPTTVPGGLFGNGLVPLAFQVRYAGASDFYGLGFIALKLKVISPVLPRTCFIGTDSDPMTVVPQTRTQPVEVKPGVYLATIQDNRFAIPRAHGCGIFTRIVEHRFGVPSAAGTNEITLPTYTSIKQYDASHS